MLTICEYQLMPSPSDFANDVRSCIGRLHTLAASAGLVTNGISPIQRAEAAEFLRQAAESCEDAIRAVGEQP
jgi:hypothetical protein